ncbi:hypothetical protein [Haladaptatus sp. R4]|nr:hypothetical protein [Haladaptatus sp. R4]
MAKNNALRAKLTEHPRLIGVLFALTLLVTQFGPVLAGGGSNSGP